MKKDNLRNSEFYASEWDLTTNVVNKKNFLKSTPDGACTGKKYKKKNVVKCPLCRQTFKTVKGTLPKHKKSWLDSTICPGDKYKSITELKNISVCDENIIIGDEIVVTLISSLYPKHFVVETITKYTIMYSNNVKLEEEDYIVRYYINHVNVDDIKEIVK